MCLNLICIFLAEPELGPFGNFSECMAVNATEDVTVGPDQCPSKGGVGERTRTRECLPAGVCPNCDNIMIPCVCNGTLEETEECIIDG